MRPTHITVQHRHHSLGYDITLEDTHFEPNAFTMFSLTTDEATSLLNALAKALGSGFTLNTHASRPSASGLETSRQPLNHES